MTSVIINVMCDEKIDKVKFKTHGDYKTICDKLCYALFECVVPTLKEKNKEVTQDFLEDLILFANKALENECGGRNMTADEMFKELGYEKIREDEKTIKYHYDEDGSDLEIEFFSNKTIEKYYLPDFEPAVFTAKEIQAINKKVEELQWN